MADWPAASPAELDATTLAPLLELQPAIILLGVLARHAPPPRSLASSLQRRGIAIETMTWVRPAAPTTCWPRMARLVAGGIVSRRRRGAPEEDTGRRRFTDQPIIRS